MISLRLSEIALATEARLVGLDLDIQSVSTDSRAIKAGDLFIALKGPNFDAHQFVADVVDKGAVAVITEQQLDVAVPQLVVADTKLALGQLGALVKQRLQIPGSRSDRQRR